MTHPYLALGLAGPHLVELTSSPALVARWDALPLAFTVLGADRFDASPEPVTLDSSSVAAALARRTGRARFLVAASPHRDHPYNLARRIVSLGHLSRGRSGVLLGGADPYAPPGPDGAEAWGGAGLGGGAPLTPETVRDAARAVRALELSWPYDSIVADRETGILVRSDRILHVDLVGAFPIAGPLTAPEPPTGASVIALLAAGARDDAADLTIGDGGAFTVVADDDPLPTSGSRGALLRPPGDRPLAEVLDRAETLLADGFERLAPGGPLRAALGLPLPPRPTGRAAFPVPQPYPSL